LMSFLEIGDRAAGAIKSGGTTRRAAKMIIVDADHPDIEQFVEWKVREEQKAAAMWIGSTMLNDPELREILSKKGLLPMSIEDQLSEGMSFGVFSIDYEGEAIRSVGGQNANNTVRVSDRFMDLLSDPQGAMWYTKERTTGKLGKGMQVGYLWRSPWARTITVPSASATPTSAAS
jgi:ribonucleoside-diphosphate reductase alpha chain